MVVLKDVTLMIGTLKKTKNCNGLFIVTLSCIKFSG